MVWGEDFFVKGYGYVCLDLFFNWIFQILVYFGFVGKVIIIVLLGILMIEINLWEI